METTGRLDDYTRLTVLLCIWATWFLLGREEIPALDPLEEMLGGDDFIVLPLSLDEAGTEQLDYHCFVRTHGQSLPYL